MNITANTILITGGATGIGLALAAELVGHRNEVIICGRRESKLAEAKQRVPRLHTIVADVGDRASREELVKTLIERFPKLNMLVNNAGVQHTFDVTAGMRDVPKADEEIAINLTAPIHLIELFIGHLMKQPAATIVNISSGLAFAPLARMPVYCATKAALHSLSLSFRHQLRNTSVKLFEIIPPVVTSELGAYHRPPGVNETAMPAETAAAGIIEALQRDEFEPALGEAANLREKREKAFPFMNKD